MGVLRPHKNKLWASGFWFPGSRGDFLQIPWISVELENRGEGQFSERSPRGLSRGLLPMLGAPCLGEPQALGIYLIQDAKRTTVPDIRKPWGWCSWAG